MLNRSVIVCALLSMLSARSDAAVTTTISTSPGTLVSTGSVASFEPTGEDMAGMLVKVTFADSETQTATWAAGAVGSKAGSAGGTTPLGKSWFLSEGPGSSFAGDTYGGKWELANLSGSAITELVLFGTPGDTLFDLKDPADLTSGQGVDPNVFTPGSEKGWTFEILPGFPDGYVLNVHASYENEVQVGIHPVMHDLYTTLRLTFSNPPPGTGLNPGYSLVFYQDTDLSGEELISNDPAPEPSSLAIFGGLAVVGGWYRMRRRHRR